MNKTAFKIFIYFTLTATLISTILLIINFLGFIFVASDPSENIHNKSPQGVLDRISENFTENEDGFLLTDNNIIPSDYWCILIDENGNIVWSQNQPDDIPTHYKINDIAKMSRWFLNDYPVYVRTEDYGLFVLGQPKNAVGKYNITYSMAWFNSLPQRLTYILLLNICFAAIFAFLFGFKLYKRLNILISGINDLRLEKSVYLKESGIFKEITHSINITSSVIERKNSVLAQRDNARSNWISGISHDIRTPLSVIMGYSEELSNNAKLSEESRNKAETIKTQSIKIKKLIEDLNIISSLEYDMQPSKKTNIRICPLLRRVVTDIINSGLSNNFEINLDLQDEKATVIADESLIERAVFNLINNSITHNENGCIINISEHSDNQNIYITISDNGKGVPNEVINNITEIPKSIHGLGLPMAYRIVRVHGGKFTAVNNNGFTAYIELPK